MRFHPLLSTPLVFALSNALGLDQHQSPLLPHDAASPPRTARNVSLALYTDLEEASRPVDIAYCVGITTGIAKPFACLSRCADFPLFELVTTWDTGPLLSDSCGYVALDHSKARIVLAFRGTYSVANTIVDLSTVPQEYVPYPGGDGDGDAEEPKCGNCTVHMGFHSAWANTRKLILPEVRAQAFRYPNYTVHLIGHSLGGAVAALGALDLRARGFEPLITTFGEPRIGNANLAQYLDARFGLLGDGNSGADRPEEEGARHEKEQNVRDGGRLRTLRYRRVTHINDPIPLLPLSEWGFHAHAGEIFISKPSLSPDVTDLQHCVGDADGACSAGQDETTRSTATDQSPGVVVRKRTSRSLVAVLRDEVHELIHEPWGVPTRYQLWQLFFAHRDYFWRLGLCVPGGDPLGGGGGGSSSSSSSS